MKLTARELSYLSRIPNTFTALANGFEERIDEANWLSETA
jgi:hypothetical protein